MKLTIYIDGACRFNPGPAGIGVWIIGDEGRTIAEISEYIGEATNNVAEWGAYLRALKEALALGAGEAVIFTDSKLLAEQVRGTFKVRDPRLQGFWREAKRLEPKFTRMTLTHIPRENNKRADALSKKAVEGRPRQSEKPAAEAP
ncbi:MAG: ribonuclease HI family protein [Elusimicrobia bacterium]|nr:ribonuclease HI family protein [Elusimicrobiota bacterium]